MARKCCTCLAFMVLLMTACGGREGGGRTIREGFSLSGHDFQNRDFLKEAAKKIYEDKHDRFKNGEGRVLWDIANGESTDKDVMEWHSKFIYGILSSGEYFNCRSECQHEHAYNSCDESEKCSAGCDKSLPHEAYARCVSGT